MAEDSSNYSTFGQIYLDKNPYVPINFKQVYPMYLAPEFGKYYTNPLRGPAAALNAQGKPKLNSNVRGVSNLGKTLEQNYMMNGGYNMLGGGQEAMQNVPSFPFMTSTQAYENDYYFTNQNLDLGDVWNDTKSLQSRERFEQSGRAENKVNVNAGGYSTSKPVQGYRDPECMRQNIECGSKNLAVKYPIEPAYGVRKCGCF